MDWKWTKLEEAADPEIIPPAAFTEIALDNRYEVRRWCQRFICTEAQLRAAVAKVGNDPLAVKAALLR